MFRLLLVGVVLMLSSGAFASDKMKVAVGIPPLKYFVENVAGDEIEDPFVILPKGFDPEVYEPKPSDLAKISTMDVVVLAGVHFEVELAKKISSLYPDIKIVRADRFINKRFSEYRHSHGEHHHADDDDGHLHFYPDPHIWLSPTLAVKITSNIIDQFSEIMPEHRQTFEKNGAELLVAINDTDERVRKGLAGLKSDIILVYHPAWGYFADEYGLRQLAIEVDGRDPKPKEMKELIQEVKAAKYVEVLIVESSADKRKVKVIASDLDVDVEVVNIMSEDWVEIMIDTVDALKR